MAKYFHISSGLRGAYLSDNACVMKCNTRRELKAAIEYDANDWHEAGYAGLSKKAIASFVAELWREAHKERAAYLPYCLAMKQPHASTYSWGIFGSVASRAEYLEHLDQEAGQ